MNNKNKLLFSNFNPVSKQEWIEKVNIDLKGADFNKKLVWKNLNKINFQPFYTVEDKQVQLKNTGKNSQNLVNYRSISATNELGNKLALKAVEEGINGLLFEVTEKTVVSKLLKHINLNEITVSFILKSNEIAFATEFFLYVEKQKIAAKNLKGYFNLEIISNYITKNIFDETIFNKAAELVKLAVDFPNFKAISISGTEYLDSGANQVQEIAYTLNSLVFLIEKYVEKGIDTQTIFNNLHFQLAIGSEYFIEISKFRAFNNLLQEIANKYKIEEFSHVLTAKTAVWSKSITDAHTNLLRATTETMSAILGNVHGVLIDAYDKEFNETSDFSSRIAGNISTILKEESYFGKVENPVDGSYYIEEVTAKIAEKALLLFKEIENNGGFYQAFEKEMIQQQIAEIRQEKIKLLCQRKLAMVGVNKYPNLMETVAENILSNGENITKSKVLIPRRASLEIEAIRKVTEEIVAKTNIRPKVALISFGDLTMRKARAAFAYDFIGVSGFNILPEQSFEDVKNATETSAKSESNVVIMCSSDEDYNKNAVAFVKGFRSLNKNKVLLLAGNPTHLIDELSNAGLDGFIHVKSDIVTTISKIQHKINKTLKSLES
jgi:methylmalonyl-CoA mutase